MSNRLYESEIEQIALDILQEENDYTLPLARKSPKARARSGNIQRSFCRARLRAAIDRLNPTIPAEAREDAAKKAMRTLSVNLMENNETFHRMLTDGIDVKFSVGDGKARTDKVWLVDFTGPGITNFWRSTSLRCWKITLKNDRTWCCWSTACRW